MARRCCSAWVAEEDLLVADLDLDKIAPNNPIVLTMGIPDENGLFVNSKGIHVDLPKSLEPTSQDPAKLYLGHTLDEVINSPSDLLADQILATAKEPVESAPTRPS